MRRRSAPVVILLAAALTFAGCASPTAEPTAWQSTVATVATQASGGDYAGALATLNALEAEVATRRDAGELAASEAEAILGRIATVRADLTSLAPTPTPTPTVQPVQTSEPAPQQPTDGEQDQSPNKGPGDNGKGNGKGNGNGPGSGGGPGKKG